MRYRTEMSGTGEKFSWKIAPGSSLPEWLILYGVGRAWCLELADMARISGPGRATGQ